MVFPSSAGATNGANCPAGWVHTPHLFYEVYWNTPLFASLWTPGEGKQPFVLAEGDPTGYSLHADFISGWDVEALQQVIDNCDTGDSGLSECPGLIGGLADQSLSCNIDCPVNEQVLGFMPSLPGDNPINGWGQTNVDPPSSTSPPTTTGTAPPPTTTLGFNYLGCYSDSGSPRTLTGVQFANLGEVSTSACITYCANAGYSMAGTEYASQCFCGNSINSPNALIGAPYCNMPCSGDASQTCGGSSAMSIWQKA